ncbi:MAG TPA: S8 family serine peptidase [Polyangiaceae bacterium]|nr:S8 family serine peptidase [Polyangiaceae bacterium]
MTRLARFAGFALSIALTASPVIAAPTVNPPDDDSWLSLHVVLQGPCVLDVLDLRQPFGSAGNIDRARRQLDSLRQQHEWMTEQVESLGGEVVASIKRLANVLQVRIPARRASRLTALSGVVRVESVPYYERSLSSAVPFVGAPRAWETPGATGAGIRIGIIDTGIDYLHADFGGSGNPQDYTNNDRTIIEPGTFPTAKVVGGWDFVGDKYNGSSGIKPDPDPLDCFEEESTVIAGGHGTHVAGIAAGMGVNLDGSTFSSSYLASLDPKTFRVFPGVAPEASLYALKIFGCDGGTNMVISAIDWAVDPNDDGNFSDHLDVLNMSLGGSYGLQSQTEAEIVKNATLAGMLLVVAAGNDGDTFFVTGEPATYTETLSVAATVDEISYLALRIDSPSSIAGNIPCAEGAFSRPLIETGSISGTLVATEPADACSDLQNASDLSGRIAYIKRGNCYFVDKVQRAVDAGALAAVIVDNVVQNEPFSMGGDGSQKPIPAVLIRNTDGTSLSTHLAGGVNVTLDAHNTYVADIPSDQIASFSSRGPRSIDGRLKPDVAAPGLAILSAGVGSGTDPRETSGTSMACPMAAGAAAVLRQAHPSLSAFDIKAMMMNTTAPMANPKGIPVPVSLGGAGRIRVDDAARQTVTVAAAEPPGAVSLSFGTILTAQTVTTQQDLVISNHGLAPRVFDLSAAPTYPLEGASISVSPSTVTVDPQATATVTVSLTLDPDKLPIEAPDPHTPATLSMGNESYPRHFITEFGGSIVLSDQENPSLRVPFHAIVRAADRHAAGEAAQCIVGDDPPISIPIQGHGAHKEPVVSVFQHLLSRPLPILPPIPPGEATIVQVGIANDLASVGSFKDGKLYIAVAVAGQWTTPAKGPLSLFSIAIDTTGDFVEDYTVVAEPSSPYRFRDVLRSVTYRQSQGARVGRADLNAARRDELNTEPYFNSVLIFPVPLAALSELSEDNAAFSFRVTTQQPSFPFLLDRTDWITHDPTKAPVDTARAGYRGMPLYGPGDAVRVYLHREHWDAQGFPSLLLIHHSNELGKRFEVVTLADVGAVYPSDLEVSQNAPVEMNALASSTWPIYVTHQQGSEARDVKLSVSATNGAKIIALSSDSGTCTLSNCTFEKLEDGAQANIEVTVQAASADFEFTAEVSTAADCDSNTENDRSTTRISVLHTKGDLDPGQQPDASYPLDITDYSAGGGCSCGVIGVTPAPRWFSWLSLLAISALRKRRCSNKQSRR